MIPWELKIEKLGQGPLKFTKHLVPIWIQQLSVNFLSSMSLNNYPFRCSSHKLISPWCFSIQAILASVFCIIWLKARFTFKRSSLCFSLNACILNTHYRKIIIDIRHTKLAKTAIQIYVYVQSYLIKCRRSISIPHNTYYVF